MSFQSLLLLNSLDPNFAKDISEFLKFFYFLLGHVAVNRTELDWLLFMQLNF